ncbi:MAG: M23 family metallopeptidase [Chloroflexota bacterium]
MLKILRSKWLRWTLLVGLLAVAAVFSYISLASRNFRTRVSRIGPFMSNPADYDDWVLIGGERCGNAPFLIPSSGYLGVAWNDGVAPLYQHTGFDFFSPDGADNVTPIYAVYDGFLTREDHWRSAVIIRHPDFDELPAIVGDEKIWTYYTHMASQDGTESFISEEFPRGTREKFVEAGTLLGYQGSWAGTAERDMSRHLHLSIVKSDNNGAYLNETEIANTFDPTPFFGLTMRDDGIIQCLES